MRTFSEVVGGLDLDEVSNFMSFCLGQQVTLFFLFPFSFVNLCLIP